MFVCELRAVCALHITKWRFVHLIRHSMATGHDAVCKLTTEQAWKVGVRPELTICI